MPNLNILLIRDHDGQPEFYADFFVDEIFSPATCACLIAQRITKSGNRLDISRVLACDGRSNDIWREVMVDDPINVGFVRRDNILIGATE